ncbi:MULTISPECIES: DUF4231 domain-containing protein [unclassified Streptomyces]|uniref:DUF4231 domain-containing protein n=1 Tax=unclassified Streptomyces TaxID=2593676 RepID=UPI001F5BE190|nr:MULTISPECIES: DUF4231 domain-containing protein [unclassified Streptomyces]
MADVGDAPEPGVRSGEMTPQRYIEGRLAQYQGWYDAKATRMKAMHLRMRTVSVVGGALVPVFVNLDLVFARVTATVLSVVVVAAVSLESVYRYREQWKNYRSTEQLLGHERVYFETKVGPYHNLPRREAFSTLVARVEKAIANENSATLNVMTLGGQVNSDVQQHGIPAARAAGDEDGEGEGGGEGETARGRGAAVDSASAPTAGGEPGARKS